MIIDRFGDTYALAQPLGILKAEDDWEIARPPITSQVGGMGGAFDYYGSKNFPVAPVTATKTVTVTSELIAGTPYWILKQVGTGSVFTAEDSGFAGIYINIRPEMRGNGTLFLTEVAEGNQVRITFGGTLYIATVDSIASDLSLTVTDAFDLPYIEEYPGDPATGFEIWELITPYSRTYAGVETAVDLLKANTIAKNESKLWMLSRSGDRRWAWAKCVLFKPPEKYGNKMAVPVTMVFNVPEGLWYAETESSLVITNQGFPYTFTLTNHGTLPALLKCVIANGAVSYLTLPKLENLTNGQSWTFDRAGSTEDVRLSHTLSVDAAAYAVTDDAADAYASLTLGATQTVFMQLEPGDNSMRFTGTFSSATEDYTATLTWHDTYL